MKRRYSLFFFFIGISAFLFSQQKVYLQKIDIEGNKLTKTSVILREMTIHIGDSLEKNNLPAILLRNQQNIYNLSLFNLVKIDSILVENRLSLKISVKERWYIFPMGGLVSEERNSYDVLNIIKKNAVFLPPREWIIPRFSYDATLVWLNMTGHNNRAWLAVQGGFAQRVYTGYVHPWLLPKQRIDFYAGINYAREKQLIAQTLQGQSQWVRTYNKPIETEYSGYIALRKRFDAFKSLYMSVNYKYKQFNDSIYHFNPFYLPEKEAIAAYPSLVLQYMNDRRDIKAYPLKGYRYRALLRVAGFVPGSTSSFVKMGATFAHYKPLTKRLFLSYGTHNIVSFGKKIPYFEKNFLWIDKDDMPDVYNELRGYERYSADAQGLTYNKVDLKYAILPRKIYHFKWIPWSKFQDMPWGIYATSFCDTGYMWDNSFNNQDAFLKNKFLYGYGLGLNVIGTYDLLGRFEVSLNHLNQLSFNVHATIPIR